MSGNKTLVVNNRTISPESHADMASALAERMKPGGGFEAGSAELKELGVESPAELAGFYAEFSEALQIFEENAVETGSEVMTSPQNRIAALLQSLLAEKGEGSTLTPLAQGGLEVKFDKMDWWGWFKSLFTWVKKEEFHPLLRPSSHDPEPLGNQARLAIFGDWGTNLYGAPVIADTLHQEANFDVVMHLGDVYYAGTKKEMQNRFLDPWPTGAGAKSRGLNSNHDMYSGGHAYFGMALPAFGQKSSYFAMQNDYWTLIALDAAYVDHDVDEEQKQWVYEVVKNAGQRKVLLFSHQQLFSGLGGQGPKLAASLAELLTARRVYAWYWAHLHRCEIYERHPIFGLLGRCIGHGGMPEKRGEVKDLPPSNDPVVDEHTWRRIPGKHGVPGGLVLEGPNRHIAENGDHYLPHGFAVLQLDGPRLTEVYRAADGRELKRIELQ